MTPAGQSARSVRQHFALGAELPPNWRCRLCGRRGTTNEATPCEGLCGGWLHWNCYWPGLLTPTERAAWAAAEAADEMTQHELEGKTVEMWVRDRRFEVPAIAWACSAVEDFLEHQVVLCYWCRS
jgi:hypothetical protein